MNTPAQELEKAAEKFVDPYSSDDTEIPWASFQLDILEDAFKAGARYQEAKDKQRIEKLVLALKIITSPHPNTAIISDIGLLAHWCDLAAVALDEHGEGERR